MADSANQTSPADGARQAPPSDPSVKQTPFYLQDKILNPLTIIVAVIDENAEALPEEARTMLNDAIERIKKATVAAADYLSEKGYDPKAAHGSED